FFFLQAGDGIRYFHVLEFRRVLFRSQPRKQHGGDQCPGSQRGRVGGRGLQRRRQQGKLGDEARQRRQARDQQRAAEEGHAQKGQDRKSVVQGEAARLGQR